MRVLLASVVPRPCILLGYSIFRLRHEDGGRIRKAAEMTEPIKEAQRFVDSTPTLENYWRAIILFGRNVASYKFALAKALLDLQGRPGELVRLEELAVPFSRHICDHLRLASKQTTSSSSKFLEACGKFNEGTISQDELVSTTVRLGFNNVIDAFHNVNQQEVPVRFFADDRRNGGVRLTDSFYSLFQTPQGNDLPEEVESRWRLVETAWALNLSRNVISVGYDSETEQLFSRREGRRTTITSCRGALNGYQKGKCFYCGSSISVVSGDAMLADVDHFFPHVLSGMDELFRGEIDSVWNLVLACAGCNRGKEGKGARLPDLRLVEKLHRRNEYLISSHHPLRETIMAQTGRDEPVRRDFLQKRYLLGKSLLIHTWHPTAVGETNL